MNKKRYPREILNQIRKSINLSDLVKRYTTLDKNGRALCPFHKDKNPSLSINTRKGLWYCFGCGKGGDAFSFIMLAEKVTFPTAIKVAALDAGIKLPE